MNTGDSATDYGYLNVTARKGVSVKGRSKVMIVLHEADREEYGKLITDDVLKAGDCAVFTRKPGAEQELRNDGEAYSEHLQNIGEMRILVAVVTGRFLSEDCFARNVEVPKAIEQNVAVLPIIVETGLVSRFNSDPVFSGMQFLDRTSTDTTELGYDTKLKKFMDSLILTQTDVSDIRRHHTGHAFLSYRKKDRPLAKKLMTIIHNVRQDLAIWYDEFLTPGKHFDDEIAETIRESELFAMSMTPNMLEKPNYVEEHEYKTAEEAKRDILPVTMKDMGTADVEEVYPGLGTCIDAEDTDTIAEKINAMSERFKGYTGDTEKAEHKYYIALGFLNGIDAETDGARAEKLLREAAALHDGKYSKEAYRKLVSMYLNGAGVERSRQTAKAIQAELYEFCVEVYRSTETYGDLADLVNELMVLGGLYYDDNETGSATDIYEQAALIIKGLILENSAGKNAWFCDAINELASLAFTRLSVIYVKAGEREKAKGYIETGIAVDKQISETIGKEVDSDYRRLCEEGNQNEQMALSAQISGNNREGIDLFLRNVEIEREILSLPLTNYDPDEVKRISLGKIIGWYSRAANHAIMAGWYDEAREYCEKAIEVFQKELGSELRLMGSADSQGEMFWTYFHLSEVGRLTDDFELMSDAAEQAVKVLEEIIEQSSAEKWGPYLQNMRDRIIRKPQTEQEKKKKEWFEQIPYTEDGVPDVSEYNPFGDAYVPYPKEDNYDTLDMLLNSVDYMKTGVFREIARSDYKWIREKYLAGGYSMEPDPYGKKKARMDERIRKLGEEFGESAPEDGEEAPANEEDALAVGEDIPFGDDYSGDDNYETLLDDIERTDFMMQSGYTEEARDDLLWIVNKLKDGGYNVDDETVRQQTDVINKLLIKCEKELEIYE